MASNSSTNSSAPTSLFAPIQVSTMEQIGVIFAWVVYCHTGAWSTEQPLRVVVALQGYMKIILRPIFLQRWDCALSLFACYLMGRTRINWRKGIIAGLWLTLDTAAMTMELVCGGAHATRAGPLKIITAIVEGLLAVYILVYLAHQAYSIKGSSRRRWLQRWALLVLWAICWGGLVILYWIKKTSTLPLVAWLMTYSAIFHDSVQEPQGPIYEPPVINSPWLAAQAGTPA